MGTITRFITKKTVHSCCLFVVIAMIITVAFSPLANAEEAHQKEAHAFHRHHTALFLGNTQDDGSEYGLSFGLEYEYRFNHWLGLGGLVEYAGGDFEHLLLAVPLYIHPYKQWLLVLAGGAEIYNEHEEHQGDKREREWVVRTGVAYQFPIEDKWSITPSFNVDFSEHETLFVYGISVGVGF